jgi:endonuclease-3
MERDEGAAWTADAIDELLTKLEGVYGRARRIPRFDPMEELVSCILSQHTADANSFPAFTRLRETFSTWQDVVDAGPERLADVIRKAGLANQKAGSIVKCLLAIHAACGDYSLEHLRGMKMREARAWLMDLPGVGPKTASIVLCFCFGMGAIPVDTHVFRVGWRLGLYDRKVGEGRAHDVLLQIVPEEFAYRFHTTVIQHGRMTCKAPTPDCERCVVADSCAFHRGGIVVEKPAKRPGKKLRSAG